MSAPTSKQIADDVFERFIDQPVILNIFRACHVEAMVARALNEDYELTQGWEAWDLQHRTKGEPRIEVKQAAARQTWQGFKTKSQPSFDIAARKWAYIGDNIIKIEGSQRLAEIYIFAWHGVDTDECDQRNVRQWEFLVSASSKLPDGQKTITRSSLVSKFGESGVPRRRHDVLCTPCSHAAREMRVGPSEPLCRRGLQTATSCCR